VKFTPSQEKEILDAVRVDLLRARGRLGLLYGEPTEDGPERNAIFFVDDARVGVEHLIEVKGGS
jgi:hypothetical protein